MKISPFIFLAIFCIFSISTVYAYEGSLTNPTGCCIWYGKEGYLYQPNEKYNAIAIAHNYNISKVYPPDYSEPSLIYVGDGVSIISDIAFSKDYVFISYSSGAIYRLNNWNGIQYWDNLKLGDDLYLVTTLGSYPRMAFGGDGFLYAASGKYIYKINPETLTVTKSTEADYTAYNVAFGDNKIYTGGLSGYITQWNTLNSFSNTLTYSTTSLATFYANNYMFNYIPLSNGDFLSAHYRVRTGGGHSGTYVTLDIVNETAVVNNVYLYSIGSNIAYNYPDVVVNKDGIVVYTNQYTDKYYTFEIEAGASDFGDSEYVPSAITYDVANINTYYESNYNSTPVDIVYNIKIDMTQQDFTFFSDITDGYSWELDVFNPDNMKVQTYIIPETFRKTNFLSSVHFITDTVRYTPKTNGTWLLKLYEKNEQTGERALIAEDSFIVIYETSTDTGEVTTNNPTNIVNKFLESQYFIAIIIIGVIAFQFGRGQDGNINGTAMIVLIPLAVGLCCLMGILPMWILYVMVLCIIAFVAVKMSSGGS